MRRWVAESKIRVIPAAVAPPTNQDRLPREKNVILGVGRLSREKGFDVLIEAWRRIHQRLPGWTLRIAGDGPEREKLTTQAMDMPSVQLLGWTPNVWPLYQHATVFVLPSRYEGFPVALVEALSQGCPSIATRCTEATQIPPLSDALQLVDPESPEQLAEAILTIALNKETSKRLEIAGKDASSYFDWAQVGKRWDQLLTIIDKHN